MFFRQLQGFVLHLEVYGTNIQRKVTLILTSATHWTPLDRTASITASTFFSRARAFALRVGDSFQGTFLRQGVSHDIKRYYGFLLTRVTPQG